MGITPLIEVELRQLSFISYSYLPTVSLSYNILSEIGEICLIATYKAILKDSITEHYI